MVEGTPGTEFADEVTIRRIRFAAPDNSFAVVEADRDGDEVTLVGPVAHLEERERVQVAGTWQDDKRFGMQVRVRSAQPLAPSGADAVLAYLRRVKHVGPGRAAKLYDRHGDGVLDAIDDGPRAHRIVREEPYELTSVFGVGFDTADRIAGRRAGPARTAAALLHALAE